MIGAANVGTIAYDARIETKNFRSDAKQVEGIAQHTAKKLGDDMEHGSGRAGASLLSLSKMGHIAARGVQALAVAVVAATGFAVKSAASFEQTRIGLENMLGSADVARSLLKDISQFAAKTPFEFPELAGAAKQLVAFGFSAEEAYDTMKQLGNVSAAIGAPIGDLSYLMGTLRTQGRAFTIDIRQFAQRGIPIYEYLGKVLGKNTQQITEMIEAGQIGFPEVQKAFQALAGEGGKWGNTMERQSKSLTGQFSTLKDNIGIAAREFVGLNEMGDVRKGSIFDRLRVGLGKLNDVLGNGDFQKHATKVSAVIGGMIDKIFELGGKIRDYLEPKFRALGETLKGWEPTAKRILDEVIKPLATAIGTTLVWAIGTVIDYWNALYTAMQPVATWMLDNKPVVLALAAAFGVLKLAMALPGALASFQTTMAGVKAAHASMSATLATPLALPAIAVAAAIGAIVAVIAKYKEMQATLKQTESAQDNTMKAFQQGITKMKGYLNEGKISAEDYSKYVKQQMDYADREAGRAHGHVQQLKGLKGFFNFLSSDALLSGKYQGNAMGTNYWKGGTTLVGEEGPELVNLPRGSEIIPNKESMNMLDSVPETASVSPVRGGDKIVVNLNMSGIMARSRNDVREIGIDMLKAVDEKLSAMGKPSLIGDIA